MATATGSTRQVGNGRLIATGPPVQKSFAGFLRAVRKGDPDEIRAQGGVFIEKANDSLSGQGGGYLVPVEYTARFLKPLAERSFVYRRAHVVPMTSAQAVGPKVDAETVRTAGTNPFFGGILASWGNQTQTFSTSETNPQFRQLTLDAWDLTLYTIASNQMLQDMGPEADQRLLQVFGDAAAWYAEYAFFLGLGAGSSMPLGMINAPGTYEVTRAGAGAISVVDVAKMIGHLIPSSWMTACWAVSPSALEKVVQITGYQPNMPREEADEGCCGYLHHRPVFITDKVPKLGTRGDLTLFDPALYCIGDRMQVIIDVSDQAVGANSVNVFQTNQSMFRVALRMDGKPMLDTAVRLVDGDTMVSGVVVLST